MTDQPKIKGKLRTLRCDLGFLKRADASAAFEQGTAIVWCSVNGPGDVMASKRLTMQMLVEISNRRVTDPDSKKLSDTLVNPIIEHAIERNKNPRSTLVITLQEMNRDGEYAPVAINAACLALLDAGIEIRYPFAAVCISVDKDGIFTLDPDSVTLTDAKARFIFVFKPSPADLGGKVIGCDTSGNYTLQTYRKALEHARHSVLNIFDFYRVKMQEKYTPWLRIGS